MPWLKLDDHLDEHPKLNACCDYDAALSTFVQLALYCARNLTDGVLPSRIVERHDAGTVEELLRVGFLEPGETPATFSIHDYLDYNPTREQVAAERKASTDRVKRWRNAHRNGDGNGVTNGIRTPAPYPYPEPSPNPEVFESENDSKTKPLSFEGIDEGVLGVFWGKVDREPTAAEVHSLRSLCKNIKPGIACFAIGKAFEQIHQGYQVDELFGLITTIARGEVA